MSSKTKKPKARMGRPPRLVDGIRVSDLPDVKVRMTPEAKARLEAMSKATGRPRWELVQGAVLAAWDVLKPDVRKAAERELRKR